MVFLAEFIGDEFAADVMLFSDRLLSVCRLRVVLQSLDELVS